MVVVALALVALMLVGPIGVANDDGENRALTVGTYYVYFHGGTFPTGHGINIYKETNGLGKNAPCSVSEGVPVWHNLAPALGKSGLQTPEVCPDLASDQKIA
ncbi:MAG: hypothetical protein HY775_03565 [Acidobacteria bacterium]|nr:hypothetical protein [Acidobacteriota bacterium]